MADATVARLLVAVGVDLNDLNKSTILDYDGLNIPPTMIDYYTAMAYQIMSSHIFEYFHYHQ